MIFDKSLRDEFFKTDNEGKPTPLFKIRTDNTPQRTILNMDHCALIYPQICKIDKAVQSVVDSIGHSTPKDVSVDELIQACEEMNHHADKLIAQAIYLDTADRNSWQTIKQTLGSRHSAQALMKCEPRMLDFLKFNPDFPRYSASFHRKREEKASENSFNQP